MAASAKVASAYIDLVARTEAFERALDDAKTHVRKFNSELRAEMREGKGAIALLGEEVGIHLPRHLQTFLAKLPGVAPAMSAAFNAVAVFALADIVFKAGEKVVEFVKKNEEAAKKNVLAWESAKHSIGESNDELELTKAKLENAIAKLEHKPQNALKEAIAEARVEADKLGDKLTTDVEKISGLLKSEQAGWFASNVLHRTGGQSADKIADETQEQLAQVGAGTFKVANPNASFTSLMASRGDATAQYAVVINENLAKASAELARIAPEAESFRRQRVEHPHMNMSNAETDEKSLTQLVAYLRAMQNAVKLTGDVQSLTGTKTGLEADATLDAETEKQNAKKLQAFESELEEEKHLKQKYSQSFGAADEFSFWNEKLQYLDRGSKAYLSARERADKGMEGMSRQVKSIRDEAAGVEPGFTKPGEAADKGDDVLAAATVKRAEAQAQMNAQWAIASARIGAATGALNPHQVALIEATAHTAEYEAKIKALADELNRLRQQDLLQGVLGPNKEQQAKETALQTQIDTLKGQGKLQSAQDNIAVLQTTWSGMINGVFDEFIKRSEETEKQIQQIAVRMIDSLNTEMSKSLTGGKTNYHAIFEQASQALAKTGLEKIEGVGLQALGLGSNGKMGTKGNPMYIKNADGATGGVASAAGKGLLGFLNDSDFFSSIFGGRIFGAGGVFGGGHALGGDVAAGVPIDVGELGRERFTPSVPGRITSHADLGGGPMIGYIDARGTDPALTRSNFEAALDATHRSAIQHAAHLIAEQQMRRPR